MSPSSNSITENYSVVVAVDFGTTRTGYSFAYTSSPDKIHPNKNWPGATAEGKTLTEILLTKKLEFVAFGYEARNRFLAGKEEYLLFSNFKMVLHNKQGAVRRKVKATNCEVEIPTEDLISICLREIKNRAVGQLKKAFTAGIVFERIRWVVTIPAIWDIAARQAMLNAAIAAGMPQEHTFLALEPEAAVFYCLANAVGDKKLQLNCEFMVVDAGGGTIDITVHKQDEDGRLTELHLPSGGDWGSSYINRQFENLLMELLGSEFVKSKKGTVEWYSVMDNFESAKVNFTLETPVAQVNVAPILTQKMLEDQTLDVQVKAYNAKYQTSIKCFSGQLRIATIMPTLFESVTPLIVAHLVNILAQPSLHGIKLLFLVGGFAESALLQACIEKALSGVQVVIPNRPGVAVVNGAVLYGLSPSTIKERLAPTTIGIQMSDKWNESKHAGRLQVLNSEGVRYCSECFSGFVKRGDKISQDHMVTQTFWPLYKDSDNVKISLYGSLNPEVNFTTDVGVRQLGYTMLDVPDKGAPVASRMVEVTMMFGGTTVAVTAIYKKTGEAIGAIKCNFHLDGSLIPQMHS